MVGDLVYHMWAKTLCPAKVIHVYRNRTGYRIKFTADGIVLEVQQHSLVSEKGWFQITRF